MDKKKLTFTVGIPTYYGGPGLVKTAKSVLASKGVDKFRFIVNIDGNPLDPKIEKQLRDLGVEVVFSKQRGGQVARIKQMISMTKTDIIVLTQDDILFEKDTLKKVVEAFEKNTDITMVSARLLPIPAKILFERIIETGVHLTHRVGDAWKGGDNYLLSSGRLLAFRSEFVKKLDIPEEVINSDAYLYFENNIKGGKFLALRDAVVYNKSPQTLKEHLKQSRKFQYPFEELGHFLKSNLESEYTVPRQVSAIAYLQEFIHKPFYTFAFMLVYLYTRVAGRGMYSNAKRFWDTDVTTKKI